jgi:hypothetical protein
MPTTPHTLPQNSQGQQHHHRIDVLVVALHARLDHVAADEQDGLQPDQQHPGLPVGPELHEGEQGRGQAGRRRRPAPG